jgi:hypothetical protein
MQCSFGSAAGVAPALGRGRAHPETAGEGGTEERNLTGRPRRPCRSGYQRSAAGHAGPAIPSSAGGTLRAWTPPLGP